MIKDNRNRILKTHFVLYYDGWSRDFEAHIEENEAKNQESKESTTLQNPTTIDMPLTELPPSFSVSSMY